MIVDVTKNYQLRCIDGLNWQVYQYREVEIRENKKPTGKKKMEWVPLQSYHGTVESGVKSIAKNYLKGDEFKNDRVSLKEFISSLEKVKREIGKYAKSIGVSNGSKG